MRLLSNLAIGLSSCLILVSGAPLAEEGAVVRRDSNPDHYWVPIWATATQATMSNSTSPMAYETNGTLFADTTIRQTFTMTQPASRLRLRVSNVYSSSPLNLTAVTVALPIPDTSGSPAIDPSTLVQVYFGGKPGVSVPAGAEFLSDPIELTVVSQCQLSVSAYLASGQAGPIWTYHATTLTTSYGSSGDVTRSANVTGTGFPTWHLFTAVEGYVPKTTSAFVALGDSITDGYRADRGPNTNWPGYLLSRMQDDPSTENIAVLNAGISGNQVGADSYGAALMSRVALDANNRNGIKYAILLEGINDIGSGGANTTEGQDATYEQLVQNYQQLCTRFQSQGVPLFGGTLLPFKYRSLVNGTAPNYWSPLRDVTRQRINDWIRSADACFDSIVDFDAVMRNETDPDYLQSQWDSGDGLHPNSAGYERMAQAIDLGLFSRFSQGVDNYV